MRMKCPHCATWATARSTEDMTVTSRKAWMQCRNVECGHTFTAALTVLETLSPSAVPNPAVVIPQSPHIKRSVLGQQLERAPLSDYRPRTMAAAARDLFDDAAGQPMTTVQVTLPPTHSPPVPKTG